MSSESSVDPQAIESTKQQIRGLVDELAAISKQNLPPDAYYAEFLKRIVEALAAVGGAVWTLGEEGRFGLAYQINLQRASLDVEGDHQLRHARLLANVARSGEGMLVPPHSGGGDESEGANPTELLLVLAPLKTDQRVEGVIEIFQRPTPQPAARRGYLRFLLQMCELAGEWLKSRKLQQFSDRASLWGQVDDFARSVHESLDTRLIAYTIANEGQRLIGCDRVSVAIRKGSHCVIEAVSGQDTFDTRSNVVTLLGKLATQVVAAGEPLWYTGDADDLPPQVEDAVHEYVDHAHSKTVAIFPLLEVSAEKELEAAEDQDVGYMAEGKAIAALIVEQIEDIQPRDELAARIDLVCGHSARALSNAHHYNGLFLMPLWRAIGNARWMVRARTLPKTITVAGLILAAVLAMVFVPGSFDMEGKGVLQPAIRRDVFVDVDGVVTRVHVKHGQQVNEGDLLVELRNTDLEVRLADVAGQARATEEQLFAANRRRHESNLPTDERDALAGQVLQLEQRLKSLRRQRELLLTKKSDLLVKSPISGQVVTWNVERELMHRPVSLGQVLLTVADPNSPWELEVYMPEKRMGHIATAVEDMGDDLHVEYVVATDPTRTSEGTVRSIQSAAEMHEEHGQSVSILVEIDKQDLVDPRPGATVTAKVHCGYRSIGYVWLHDAFEFVQSRILFRL